jgi:uncharacterized protein YuzE
MKVNYNQEADILYTVIKESTKKGRCRSRYLSKLQEMKA